MFCSVLKFRKSSASVVVSVSVGVLFSVYV